MNKRDFTAAVPDKVDMSLDDIIRLNKKQQQFKRKQANVNRRPMKMKDHLIQEKEVSQRTAGPAQRVGGVPRGGAPKLGNRKVPPIAARPRGQGVITELAARRPAALMKPAGTLNMAAINQKTRQKTRPFFQRPEAQYSKPEEQRQLYRQPDQQRGPSAPSVRRPFQLLRRPQPPVQQTQREARQATFFFHRGLKVQTQVQKPNPCTPPVRTRQSCTSTASSGILTVSIDNPTARTKPPPALTPHPRVASVALMKVETVGKKIPKGVTLQFDISSVGKTQTSMTLNERFRILKERRNATAQSSKGRFVTVG